MWILTGVLVTLTLSTLIIFRVYKKIKHPTVAPVAPPAVATGVVSVTQTTTQPATQNVNTPQAVPVKSNSVYWLVAVLLLVGTGGLVLYILPNMYPNVKVFEVLKTIFSFNVDLKSFAPYLVAPLVGLVSYYWSKWGHRSLGASLVMVAVTCFLITLWIHPGFMTAVLEPYLGPASMHQFVGPSNFKLFMIVAAVSLVAVIMGYIFEVACFLAIMFFFFFYLSYTSC